MQKNNYIYKTIICADNNITCTKGSTLKVRSNMYQLNVFFLDNCDKGEYTLYMIKWDGIRSIKHLMYIVLPLMKCDKYNLR